MHKQWEDLIPFYIAQTLPRPEAAALEQHLAGCDLCQRSLEEWRAIAAAVRMQAASQLRDLPPLNLPLSRAQVASQRRRDPWRWLTPLVLASAAVAVVVGAGLIALIVSRSLRPIEEGGQVSIAGLSTNTPTQAATTEPTPIIFSTMPPPTIAPTHTPLPPTARPIQRVTVQPATPTRIPFTPQPPLDTMAQAYSTTPVPDLAPLLGATEISPMLLPTEQTEQMLTMPQMPSDGQCRLSAALSQFSLYSGPGVGYPPLIDLDASYTLRPMAVGDNGWYRIEANIRGGLWYGWISPSSVTPSGDCSLLPLLPTQNYLPEAGVPTAGVPMEITITPEAGVATETPFALSTETPPADGEIEGG
jgi:hypothetical protein